MRGNSLLGMIVALAEAQAVDAAFEKIILDGMADGIVAGYCELATAAGMSHEEAVKHLAHISTEKAWPEAYKILREGIDPEKAKADLRDKVLLDYARETLACEKPATEQPETSDE